MEIYIQVAQTDNCIDNLFILMECSLLLPCCVLPCFQLAVFSKKKTSLWPLLHSSFHLFFFCLCCLTLNFVADSAGLLRRLTALEESAFASGVEERKTCPAVMICFLGRCREAAFTFQKASALTSVAALMFLGV